MTVAVSAPRIHKKREHSKGSAFDPIFRWLSFGAATLLLVVLGALMIDLIIGAWPALSRFGLNFFTSTHWNPVTDVYGALGPIIGTLLTALISLVIALPLSLGIAIFLVEFCPKPLAQPLSVTVELLAGIPSIVYGMWGLFVLAPWFAAHIQLPILENANPDGLLAKIFYGVPNGLNIFTASVILAIMILPFMASVFRELFLTVPPQLRESAYGIGCMPLEVISKVTLPYVRSAAIGVVMLGLGRALGETMAVTFVIGNTHTLPKSLFDSGSTLASTIANEFTEATSDVHRAALLALGLILFVISFGVLILARLLLREKKM